MRTGLRGRWCYDSRIRRSTSLLRIRSTLNNVKQILIKLDTMQHDEALINLSKNHNFPACAVSIKKLGLSDRKLQVASQKSWTNCTIHSTSKHQTLPEHVYRNETIPWYRCASCKQRERDMASSFCPAPLQDSPCPETNLALSW